MSTIYLQSKSDHLILFLRQRAVNYCFVKVYGAHIHVQGSCNLNRGLKLLESQQQVQCLLG